MVSQIHNNEDGWLNSEEELPAVQVDCDAYPKQRVPAALQQQHQVGVHATDAEVERQYLIEDRVTDVHYDGIHTTVHKRKARPPAPLIYDQIAYGEQQVCHASCHHHK